MESMTYFLYYLVFPGLIFTAVCGMLVNWIDRKVTAKVQWRVGPPVLQPYYDFMKLLGKENVVPKGASTILFLLAPVISISAVTIVSTILWVTFMNPDHGFIGDLIVIVYLLMIPAICTIIAGFASGNPWAALGASREMKLLLAYELPFLLVIITALIKGGKTLMLGELIRNQAQTGSVVTSISGFLAFLIAIIAMQAKLSFLPFDAAEAETEIVEGPYVDYSGTPLALFKLSSWMMLFVMPVFLITIFWGGFDVNGWPIVWGILKYVLLLVVIILIKNTTPRFRIDQIMKLFWGPLSGLAVLALILALAGV